MKKYKHENCKVEEKRRSNLLFLLKSKGLTTKLRPLRYTKKQTDVSKTVECEGCRRRMLATSFSKHRKICPSLEESTEKPSIQVSRLLMIAHSPLSDVNRNVTSRIRNTQAKEILMKDQVLRRYTESKYISISHLANKVTLLRNKVTLAAKFTKKFLQVTGTQSLLQALTYDNYDTIVSVIKEFGDFDIVLNQYNKIPTVRYLSPILKALVKTALQIKHNINYESLKILSKIIKLKKFKLT
jgi:hypothetical protein